MKNGARQRKRAKMTAKPLEHWEVFIETSKTHSKRIELIVSSVVRAQEDYAAEMSPELFQVYYDALLGGFNKLIDVVNDINESWQILRSAELKFLEEFRDQCDRNLEVCNRVMELIDEIKEKATSDDSK